MGKTKQIGARVPIEKHKLLTKHFNSLYESKDGTSQGIRQLLNDHIAKYCLNKGKSSFMVNIALSENLKIIGIIGVENIKDNKNKILLDKHNLFSGSLVPFTKVPTIVQEDIKNKVPDIADHENPYIFTYVLNNLLDVFKGGEYTSREIKGKHESLNYFYAPNGEIKQLSTIWKNDKIDNVKFILDVEVEKVINYLYENDKENKEIYNKYNFETDPSNFKIDITDKETGKAVLNLRLKQLEQNKLKMENEIADIKSTLADIDKD